MPHRAKEPSVCRVNKMRTSWMARACFLFFFFRHMIVLLLHYLSNSCLFSGWCGLRLLERNSQEVSVSSCQWLFLVLLWGLRVALCQKANIHPWNSWRSCVTAAERGHLSSPSFFRFQHHGFLAKKHSVPIMWYLWVMWSAAEAGIEKAGLG